jgi:ribosome-associated translation inhibitor RaiA
MKKKYKDYIPKGDPALLAFLIIYQQHFMELAATIEQEADRETNRHAAIIQRGIDVLVNVNRMKTGLSAAVTEKDLVTAEVIKEIRKMVRRYKASATPKPDLIAGLHLICKGQPMNEQELKPILKPKLVAGGVSLGFKNHGLYPVSIYGRYPGDMDWQLIGREIKSPFIDKRPLRVKGQPEIREYMAFYNDAVRDIGQMSAVVEMTYSGR